MKKNDGIMQRVRLSYEERNTIWKIHKWNTISY